MVKRGDARMYRDVRCKCDGWNRLAWIFSPFFCLFFCRMDIRKNVRDIVQRKIAIDDVSGIVKSFVEREK